MKKNIIVTISVMFLILSSFEFIKNFNYILLRQAFNENSGASASLPAETISLKTLINSKNIQKFNLAGALNDNALLYQRAIEYTYPARVDISARDVFALKGTKLESNCKLTGLLDNVEHYVCE